MSAAEKENTPISIALALRLTPWRGSELRPTRPSTFENLLILYARRFPTCHCNLKPEMLRIPGWKRIFFPVQARS
jgi:hypothetical protein